MAELQFSKVFWKIYDACKDKPRYISNKGGTRSTKTYSTLQFLYLLIPQVDKAGDITSVVSESFPHLKKGAIRDYENIIGHPLKGDSHWNETDHTWTFDNGAKLEFFSVDNAAKVHGSQRKRLFINEANHIEYEIFRQLAVRTSSIIFIDYNPASVCWIQKHIECRDNCTLIKSTYKDNPFLSPEQVAEIESNKDDVNWWKVYGQGIEGELDGLIYNFEQIDYLPPKGVAKSESEKTDEEKYADSLTEIYGIDFGFTNDPTARVRILADHKRKHLYVREECYRTHMQNRHIVEDLQASGVGRYTDIYADCAEPKSIADIRDAGFNVIACDKDAPVKSDKLKFQLQWMQGWKLYVTKDSLNLIEELRNYTWAKDKDGTLLNQPIDKFNHCFTGDTMIETEEGLKRLDCIEEGDKVMTSEGFRNVSRVWRNGYKKILHLKLSFGNFDVRMKVTPDHKIKVGNIWKSAEHLKQGDLLWVSKNLMGRNTSSITERSIIQEEITDCIELCGNTTMARFRKDTKSTTKMETHPTIRLKTLSAFLSWLTLKNTRRLSLKGGSLKSNADTLRRLEKKHQNGTGVKRGKNGTDNTHKEKRRRLLSWFANVVESISCLHILTRCSAQTNVRQSNEEIQEQTMLRESAKSAERCSLQTSIANNDFVVGLVLHHIEIEGESEDDVYDLQVDEMHEYLANGIVVHNCLDAMRYAVWSKYGKNAGQGQYRISVRRR